ncbi:hypothetical protein [Brucella neotomae]|uniref:hypothetical protein n=1 Tax=Brucella neotomae TaxID=29460 RepID=UPI001FCB8CB4|nr:hypothetical protein [Brucella neotomae]
MAVPVTGAMAAIIVLRTIMGARLYHVLVDRGAIHIHGGGYGGDDGGCTKDQSQGPRASFPEAVYVQLSLFKLQVKRLKYRFVPGIGAKKERMKGGRLLPKNLPPHASPPPMVARRLT